MRIKFKKWEYVSWHPNKLRINSKGRGLKRIMPGYWEYL